MSFKAGKDTYYWEISQLPKFIILIGVVTKDEKVRQIVTSSIKNHIMSFWRVLLAIICPPLAVLDKGCGSILITFILWLCGWIPGVIAALIILNNPER